MLVLAIALGAFVLFGQKDVIGIRESSGGMLPTIKPGSTVDFIDHQFDYVPRVGDVVIFSAPAGAEQGATEAGSACGNPNQGLGHSQACDAPTPQPSPLTYIKRIVAGPGDTIRIVNGDVIRNGAPERGYRIEPCGTDDPVCNFPTPITIPGGYYFMLGDNRGASYDSRFWGPVPRAYIGAKAVRCSFFNTICNPL